MPDRGRTRMGCGWSRGDLSYLEHDKSQLNGDRVITFARNKRLDMAKANGLFAKSANGSVVRCTKNPIGIQIRTTSI